MGKPSEVVAMQWREFLGHMRTNWKPGEHVAFIGPTGSGKTNAMIGLCAATRRYILAFDLKGNDKTIAKTGWERVNRYPLPRAIRRSIENGEPARLVIGSTDRTSRGRAQRVLLTGQYLNSIMEQSGWTLLVPDLTVFTSSRFGGHGDTIVELLILARDSGISLVTDWQRPAGVPREAGDQTTWLGIAYTRDEDTVSRLAEMMGRSAAEMRGAVTAMSELPYSWLWVSRDPRAPIILTRPEEI